MLTALETRYAGRRFRSRTEARWAVFFDYAGIKWEYEPAAFNVTRRLEPWNETTRGYLPDFFLPESGVFVEAKGTLDAEEMKTVLNDAACVSDHGIDLVLAGDIYGPWSRQSLPRFHFHKGDLLVNAWDPWAKTFSVDPWRSVATDSSTYNLALAQRVFTNGLPKASRSRARSKKWDHALTVAREARFDRGQTPARPAG